MSAKEEVSSYKKSAGPVEVQVQGHWQSHFKEAQLNSEVIFNLADSHNINRNQILQPQEHLTDKYALVAQICDWTTVKTRRVTKV